MDLQQLTLLALQISILLTVFGFGLRASVGDVFYVLRNPGLLVRSLLAMFVIMPIFAVAVVRTFQFIDAVEIAIVALAIAPIPPLLPIKERESGGHAPYGLGLMAIIGLLSIVTVPLLAHAINPFFDRTIAISTGPIAAIVLKAAVLPLVIGLLVNAWLPTVAARIAKPTNLVANILLAAGAAVVLIAVLPAALALIGNGTVFALVLFVITGLVVGHWLGGPEADHRPVLALSTATRHPVIALTIAATSYPDEPNLVATIVMALLVSAIIAVPYVRWQRRVVAAAGAA